MARVSFEAVKRVASALGWVLLFGIVAIGIMVGVAEAVPGWGGRTWFIARNGAFELIGFGIATIVVGRLLNKRSWDEMGWRPRTGVAFGRGVALGGIMSVVAIVLAVVLDGAHVSLTSDGTAWAGIALPLILGLILAALAEELAFRGYPLTRLAHAVGAIPAMLIFAVLFGLAHVRNPHATAFSVVNIALAAIWLSIALFSQGGMGLAWGAHLGWNAGLAVLFDAPVSGYDFQVPVVEYTPGDHAWVDGGAFGPEGGIVSTVALLAGTLWLLTRPAAFGLEPSAVSKPIEAA